MNPKRDFDPVHPAEHLVEDFLKPMNMGEQEAASAIQVPLDTLRPFLNETAPLTPDLALRLERAFGASASYWMRWQSEYDLQVERGRQGEALASIPRVIAAE